MFLKLPGGLVSVGRCVQSPEQAETCEVTGEPRRPGAWTEAQKPPEQTERGKGVRDPDTSELLTPACHGAKGRSSRECVGFLLILRSDQKFVPLTPAFLDLPGPLDLDHRQLSRTGLWTFRSSLRGA